MELTKHHGLGNDFLVGLDVDVNRDLGNIDVADFAVWVCDRKRGIGADGLMLAFPAAGYDAQMVLYNADGSRAEISGNGIRCFAQAIARRDRTLDSQHILTDAGPRRLELSSTESASTILVSVEMGEVAELSEPDGWGATECHPDRPVAHLSLGNPHSVVGVEDVEVVDIADLGGRVPHVNLEIVEPTSTPNRVRMRVHERGVGVTEACGTGATATAVAAARWGLATPVDGRIDVEMDGGEASVLIDSPQPGHATLIGPATYVGRVSIDPGVIDGA